MSGVIHVKVIVFSQLPPTDTQLPTMKVTTSNNNRSNNTQPPISSPYKSSKRAPKVKKWTRPADKPKRPLSAYNIFFAQVRRELQLTTAPYDRAAGFACLARTVANQWHELSDEQRRPYEQIAAQNKSKYRLALAEWKLRKERARNPSAVNNLSPFQPQTPVLSSRVSTVTAQSTPTTTQSPQDSLESLLMIEPVGCFDMDPVEEVHPLEGPVILPESEFLEPVSPEILDPTPLCDFTPVNATTALAHHDFMFTETTRTTSTSPMLTHVAHLLMSLDNAERGQVFRSLGLQD